MMKKLLIAAVGCLFSTAMYAQAPANDDCANAIDINSLFNGGVGNILTGGPYTNLNGTTANDPVDGWACYGEPDGSGSAPELNNTVWFTFTGDGKTYFIETPSAGLTNQIDDGDTQMSLYEGTCGALIALACNEDGPNAVNGYYPAALTFTTNPGTVYYLMVDGFSFNGAVSDGDFNIAVTEQNVIACTDSSVSPGVQTPNGANFCPGDTLIVSGTGMIAPGTGAINGIVWVLSSGDITGSTDPVNDPAYLGSTSIITSPNGISSVQLIYNPQNFPVGTYYITGCVFGNGSATGTPQNLGDVTIDPACFFSGQSIMFNLLDPNDPLCTGAGIAEYNGANAVQLFPNPVNNALTIMNNDGGAAVLQITNNIGQVVYTQTLAPGQKQIAINASTWQGGVYFVTLTHDNSVSTGKFVKQ